MKIDDATLGELRANIAHIHEMAEKNGFPKMPSRLYSLDDSDIRTLVAGCERTLQSALDNGHMYVAASFLELIDKLKTPVLK